MKPEQNILQIYDQNNKKCYMCKINVCHLVKTNNTAPLSYPSFASAQFHYSGDIPHSLKQAKLKCTVNMANLAFWKLASLLYETYLMPIWHMGKCKRFNWNRWNVCFYIELIISKYHPSYLNELTFNGKISSFIKLLTIFYAVSCHFLWL